MHFLLAACALLAGGDALRVHQPHEINEHLRDLVRIAVSQSAPPRGFGKLVRSRRHVKSRRNVSAATQGRLFEMKKTRGYTGGRPDWEAIRSAKPVVPKPAAGCTSTKWAVVTSIFEPTDSIKQLAQLAGWCTVVVGDLKGPQRGEYQVAPSVVHLSADDQRDMANQWGTVKQLPWRSFGRKNLGYIYAAAQGAEIILDIDDDNTPLKGGAESVADMWAGAFVEARSVSGAPFANVYPLFAKNDSANLWPRGYPLQGIQEEPMPQSFSIAQARLPTSSVGVVQSLASGNPDVDAIYRLTGELPVAFEERLPAVLQPGTMSPFNAQATFWHRAAFPAMLLPTTVHGRVADIWRSLIAQPLLWSGNMTLAFSSPKVSVGARNEHVLMADFEAEWPLYYKSNGLLRYLDELKREPGQALSELLFEIYVQLYEHGILELGDVALAEAWIGDMLSLGASPKAAKPVQTEKQTGGSRFMLHMHFNWPKDYANALWFLEQEICHPRNFMLCAFVSDWSRESAGGARARKAFSEVTKSKHGVPVKLLDCTANGEKMPWATEGAFGRGVFFYQCYAMSLQIAKDVGAEGVMFLADDTMLMTPWSKMMPHLRSIDTMVLPFGKPSIFEALGKLDMKHFRPCDMWVNGSAATSFTNALESLSESQKRSLGFNATNMVVEKVLGDAAYVPTRQADEFQALADHFYKHWVMEEWALGTMAHLLSGEKFRPQWPMKGRSVHGGKDRRTVLDVVEEEIQKGEVSFIHPVKISHKDNKKKMLETYTRVFGP